MKIGIVTPAPPGSRYGNRVTALRWSRILRGLGHRVYVKQSYEGGRLDLLIALHANKSHSAIRAFHQEHPAAPVIVGLTGTDVYRDIQTKENARKSLRLAARLIVLQPKAVAELPPRERVKARVIYQSVDWPRGAKTKGSGDQRAKGSKLENFNVCVIGHLRPVKDPFRAAMAARLLPVSSRVRVLQVGGVISEAMFARARKESQVNPRYRWLGEQSRGQVRRMLSRCRLCILSSKMEGGANVLGEAIVAGLPVLASRISGSVGILGEDYPGYFEVGDTRGLTQLLLRAETDSRFLDELGVRGRKLVRLFAPAHEEKAWDDLLAELFS
jgi:putative glycosyltransferase (TIGR04348 family)